MLKVFSPAKINLFLKIIRKRSDGYHELSSLFQTIDLGDTLTFELSSKDSLTCTDPLIPTNETNLVLKATQLFRNKTGFSTNFKIHLLKQIPIQAGLGGGSSNAASTLWACNNLTGNKISIADLQQWSAEIGSDIPFFFSEGTAYCTGRGEHVQNLSPLTKQHCWIIKPKVGLSTPEVYSRFRLKSDSNLNVASNADIKRFFNESPYYINDLEQPAFEAKPELEEIKNNLLKCGFKTVLLSGSGSAFFCLGEGTPSISNDFTSFSTHFLNRSPIHWYENS